MNFLTTMLHHVMDLNKYDSIYINNTHFLIQTNIYVCLLDKHHINENACISKYYVKIASKLRIKVICCKKRSYALYFAFGKT